MTEIRFHGRGGQGAVVASSVLAAACFMENKHVQAFPSFGVERRGAPVEAYTRIDRDKITIRTGVYMPDHVVVLDSTLIGEENVTRGLKPGGALVLNADAPPDAFRRLGPFAVCTVGASRIARRHRLGDPGFPIVNTAILGALVSATGIVSLESIVEAIRQEIPSRSEANIDAALEAYGSANSFRGPRAN